MVVEADPAVLARPDMQLWVRNSFLDQSTAVREAAVDLVGKYVLSCPDLIEKYYDILSLRILVSQLLNLTCKYIMLQNLNGLK
jgi:cohesin loading factor subunit SCC2